MNKEWLLSLSNTDYNEIDKCLEILHNPEKAYLRIHIIGINGKSLVASFISETVRHHHIGIIDFKKDKINEMFIMDNVASDESDVEFHAGCIKKITEENGLNVSFHEAIFLMGLNMFREKKMTSVIIKNSFDCTKSISYDLTVCTDGNYENVDGKVIAFSYKKQKNLIAIDKNDVYVYKCEMCSFNYEKIDYDINMVGFFNAYLAVLAINAVKELYPEIKKRKFKNSINNTVCIGQMERVNINPRIIINSVYNEEDINHVKDAVNTVYSHKNIKYLTNKEFGLLNEVIIDDEKMLKDEIKSSLDNDVIFILGDNNFIHKIRRLFIK